MTKVEKIEEIVKDLESVTDFEIMKEMKEILNKIFGEENNQILKPSFHTAKKLAAEVGMLSSFISAANNMTPQELKRYLDRHLPDTICYQLIIKFPIVEIDNGDMKHTIEDLYVRCLIRPNGTMRSGIDGIRGKMSIYEVKSGYAHSHLPYCSATNMNFQQFCTGIGPINQVMMLLNTKFSVVNFKMFCFHLKIYVAWESKEGRPHMYMHDINKIDNNSHYYISDSVVNDVTDLLLSALSSMSNESILEMFDYDVLPTRIEVKANEKFEQWGSNIIRSWNLNEFFPGHGLALNSLLNTKDSTGRYHNIPKSDIDTSIFDTSTVLFQFKGEDIKLKVDLPQITDKENIKDEEKVPSIKITNRIGQKLSSILSKTAYSNARVRSCCAGSNKSKVAGSDSVSV